MTDDVPAVTYRRPGGLTALAVLNIIFAIIGMLCGLGLSSIASDAGELRRQADVMDRVGDEMVRHPQPGSDPAMNRVVARGMAAQMRTSSPGGFRVMSALGYVGGALLLVSAFGMLGQRRVTGRHAALGAGVALFGCAVVALMTQGFLFWGFPILGAGYAVVLVAITSTAYKKVLVL